MSSARRESDSKRHTSSKYDREPSPKRSRRDGRHDGEKGHSNIDRDDRHGRDYDQKHRRRVEDTLPLERPSSKVEDVVVRKESDKKIDELKDSDVKVDGSKESAKRENGSQVEKKHSSEPAELPRSRSHFQHDDRGYTRTSDRSSNQRAASDRGWGKDSRDRHGDREASRFRNYGTHSRDDKVMDRGNGDRAWRHDGFFELEANRPQPASRKRPAFSEQKMAIEDDKKEQKNNNERDERGNHIHISQQLDRDRGMRRPFTGDRGVSNWGERQDFGPVSRDRFAGSGGNYRDRNMANARQGPRPTGPSDKWKHDMFSEATRSPTPKNEEDQIAKVEALLAS
ncbi:unnamed protein product [Rhodiola kirilowii]